MFGGSDEILLDALGVEIAQSSDLGCVLVTDGDGAGSASPELAIPALDVTDLDGDPAEAAEEPGLLPDGADRGEEMEVVGEEDEVVDSQAGLALGSAEAAEDEAVQP